MAHRGEFPRLVSPGGRSVASPVPMALLALAARFPLADPSVLARPGPAAPPGPRPDLQPLLSVFRI